MATIDAGSMAGLETFEGINIDYEKAYQNNKFKIACVTKANSMLPSGSRVLDVGCGTGIPVSQMLSQAGLDVVGFDISPKMVQLAQSRVKGSFSVANMAEYEVEEGNFSGIFMIFAHLQMSYAASASAWGIIVFGQSPADHHVKEESAYDVTRTYVEDYNVPFMGEPLPTFLMSAEGQRNFFRSMGLEIVSETIDLFQPDNPRCDPEMQQYIIAKRSGAGPISQPLPLPKA
ncbi:methyltransferase [Botrytis cinerea]